MSLDLARIRALCFDVDGTLSDSDDYYVGRLAGWMKHVPLVPNREGMARRLVMWMESPANALFGLADGLGLDTEVITVIDWMQRHRKTHARGLPVIPGVADLLEKAHLRYPLAVVSARDQDSTMAFLQQANLVQYFDAIVTALSAKHTKPYPDPIQLAAQRIEVAPDSCLMIGDTSVDIRAGRAAGAQTVGVLCGYGEAAELQRQGADLILQTTADLDGALFGLRQ
jgi:HAD superfamily hydrolase (TIGR01509 family)